MTKLATRLDTLADGLQGEIDRKFAPRETNTQRKARMAASARLDGFHLERTQHALRALAGLHRSGSVPAVLAGLSSKKAVHDLTAGEIERSGGYYDAGRETGRPARDSEAARLLWDLVAHHQADRQRQEDLRRRLEDVRFARIAGYFVTPDPVIARMLDLAGIRNDPCVSVLEPSAGSGNILDCVRRTYPDVTLDAFEIAPALREILKLKGYGLKGGDFLEPDPEPVYDQIVMNPPFEKEQDIIHVTRALEWLRPGGRLVAVMSGSTESRSTKRAQAFRELVADHGGWFEDLPAGAFKESGTGVSTVLVVIEK
jgi:hypothetical protein